MRVTFNAPVTLSFMLVSFGFLLMDLMFGAQYTAQHFGSWGVSLVDPSTWVRGFTHVLCHAGWGHYAGNMMLMLLVGPGLEEKFGSLAILVMIMVTAFLTAVINSIAFGGASIGASGIVFMMIVLSSYTKAKIGELPLTFIAVFIFYVGNEFIVALQPDNISHFAHIMGGLSGAVFGLIFSKPRLLSRQTVS